MNDDPVIRAGTMGDVADIRNIARAAYSKYIPRIGHMPAPMTADYDADVAAFRAVVIQVREELCGYMISWPEADGYFIENIGIDPRYQGQRLGRRLIEYAVSEARRCGLNALTLYTNEAMTENLAMYAHFGFIETHRISEIGFRRVYMRWTLSNPKMID
jgi:ribosomal protein S18 acetylase RimI-like enzyme